MALKVINKTNSRFRFLYRKNSFLSQSFRWQLCKALVQSHFDYAHSGWYPNLNKRLKSKLQILQDNCIWFCLIRAHTGLNKFEKIKYLPINEHIEQLINSTNFKYFSNLSPAYMNEVLKPSGQNSTTARAFLVKLNQSFRKTNYGQNNF